MNKKPENLDELLDSCDTLMLDMDGTLLDLAYDNYMWMEHIPAEFARRNDISEEDARDFSRQMQSVIRSGSTG